MSRLPRGLSAGAAGRRSAASTPPTRAGGVELLGGLELPMHEARYLESLAALPGERVAAAGPKPMRDVDPAREAERLSAFTQGEVLTVSRTTASGAPDSVLIEYEFEGRAGRWPAAAFDEEFETTHMYGVVLNRDGVTWAVEIDHANGEAVGEPREITRTLSRRGRLRMAAPGVTVEEVFAFFDEPAAGEYLLCEAGDGTYRLESRIWSSGVTERDLAAAEQAVDGVIEATRGGYSKPS